MLIKYRLSVRILDLVGGGGLKEKKIARKKIPASQARQPWDKRCPELC